MIDTITAFSSHSLLHSSSLLYEMSNVRRIGCEAEKKEALEFFYHYIRTAKFLSLVCDSPPYNQVYPNLLSL